MSYFLFVDESGQDHRKSPYEVLAGVAVEDRDLCNLVCAIQNAEVKHFGRRYTDGHEELKGKKILKTKVFRLARQLDEFPEEDRRMLARQCLEDGEHAGKREITALAQAKLAYVEDVFDICSRFHCKIFASIVSRDAPVSPGIDHLRKDYSYLFERFYYFLEDSGTTVCGSVVFDELEKSQSHLLLDQMSSYFKLTQKGRQRSGQVIPEPFFVHSDLTTGIQIADLAAYVISWGFRTKGMTEPRREELNKFAERLSQMRYRAVREQDGNPDFVIWSFAVITDLRARDVEGV